MTSIDKIMDDVLWNRPATNIRFDDLRRVLVRLRFTERIKGSHHIYSHDGIPEILNLQPLSGGGAKPYQIKQVRRIVAKYGLKSLERLP
jgi:hypothetical protein